MLRGGLIVVLAGTVTVAQEPRADSPQSAVLNAQVMLDAAGFSPGEIDGRAGANFGER